MVNHVLLQNMEDNSQNWLFYRTFRRRSSANSYSSIRLSSLSLTLMPLLRTIANYVLDWENFACIPVAGQGHQSYSQQTKVIRSPSPALSGGHAVLWLSSINTHHEQAQWRRLSELWKFAASPELMYGFKLETVCPWGSCWCNLGFATPWQVNEPILMPCTVNADSS